MFALVRVDLRIQERARERERRRKGKRERYIAKRLGGHKALNNHEANRATRALPSRRLAGVRKGATKSRSLGALAPVRARVLHQY